MLNIKRALKQDRLLRALTGLNLQAFETMLPAFSLIYEEQQVLKPRCQRDIGGGRKAKLVSPQEKLLFILFYFKCYPSFDLAGILFDLDRSQTNRWMHRLQPILSETLNQKMVLPMRRIRDVEEFVERFPEVQKVIIDGTERPIQRPVEQEKQKLNYCAKKNRHTRKHLAAVDRSKRVLVSTPAREGKLHHKREKPLRGRREASTLVFPALRLLSKKRFHDQEDIAGGIAEEIPILLDLGFQGVQKQYVNIHLPHKKPKGRELTTEQKQENKQLSKERVICENALAGVKRYNALAHIYRNRLPDFDDKLMLTACGLWNFYLIAA